MKCERCGYGEALHLQLSEEKEERVCCRCNILETGMMLLEHPVCVEMYRQLQAVPKSRRVTRSYVKPTLP